MKQDLQTLLESVGLTEATFKEQIEPLFEARVEQTVQSRLEAITEAHTAEIENLRDQLSEATSQSLNESLELLAEKLDEFLDIKTTEWANSNAVALQESAIVEFSMNLVSSIREAASNYGAVIESDPDSTEKVNQLKEALIIEKEKREDVVAESMNIRQQLRDAQRALILERSKEGLSDLGKSRLVEMCEKVPYSDEGSFKTIVEGFRQIVSGAKEETTEPVVPENIINESEKTKSQAQKPTGVDMSLFIRK